MEIERKFLVTKLPENLEAYEKKEIEQSYLPGEPRLRIRKANAEYIMTYKSRKGLADVLSHTKATVNNETELPLSKEVYEALLKIKDGNTILKTRYLIPFGQYTIELDVFKGYLEGLIFAEVEFPSTKEADLFAAPEWLGKDVSPDKRYTNGSLSKIGSLSELPDFHRENQG